MLSNGNFYSKAVYVTVYESLQVEHNEEVEVGATVTLPCGTEYVKRGLSVKLHTETYDDYDFVINGTDESFRLPLKNGSETLLSNNVTSLTIADFPFTMPANGFIQFTQQGYKDQQIALFNASKGALGQRCITSTEHNVAVNIQGSKGDVINLTANASGNILTLCYIEAQGNGSLYYYIGETCQMLI